ncbi:MAG: hypothetical protein JNJ54_27170 [Myxococcaceae bacterium]|nr:hypothetical protein [Myxococcaceae bacterium]
MLVRRRILVLYALVVAGVGGASRLLPEPGSESLQMARQFVAMLVLFLCFIFLIYRPSRQTRAALEHASLSLQQGRVAEALTHFEALRRQLPTWSVASLRTGYTKLLLWRLLEARDDLEYARRRGGTPEIAGWLALTLSLLGDTDAARPLLGELSTPKADPRVRPLVEAILATRAGDFATALDRLSGHDVKQLPGTLGALARVLEVWAVQRTKGTGGAVDRVAVYGETGGDGLRRAWPELCAFIDGAA